MMKADFQGKYTLIPANPGWFVLHFHSVNQAGTLTHPQYSKEEAICWAIDEAGERFPISYEKNYAGQNTTIFVITPSGAVLNSHGNKWKNIEDWMKTEIQKNS
jgi:hypothetical protein